MKKTHESEPDAGGVAVSAVHHAKGEEECLESGDESEMDVVLVCVTMNPRRAPQSFWPWR